MDFDNYVKSRNSNLFEYFKNDKNNLYIIIAPQYTAQDMDLSNSDKKYLKSNFFWTVVDNMDQINAYQIFSSGLVGSEKDYTIVLKNTNLTMLHLSRTGNTLTIKGKMGISKFTKVNQLDINKIHFNSHLIKRRVIFCTELHQKLNLSFISIPSYLIVVANEPETQFIPEIDVYIIDTFKWKVFPLEHGDFKIKSTQNETKMELDTSIGTFLHSKKHIVLNNKNDVCCTVNNTELDVINYIEKSDIVSIIKDKKILDNIGVQNDLLL